MPKVVQVQNEGAGIWTLVYVNSELKFLTTTMYLLRVET